MCLPIAPVFLAHGSADPVSPPEDSVVMYLALKRAGVPTELHVYAGALHGFGVRPDRILKDFVQQVEALDALGDSTNLEEVTRKIAALKKDAKKELDDVLTDDQKRSLQTLLGPQFKIER